MPEGRIIDSKELLGNPYKKLVELLIEQPKNDKLESAIPNETKVNKAELKNDIVYLDLSKEFIEKHINGEKRRNSYYLFYCKYFNRINRSKWSKNIN